MNSADSSKKKTFVCMLLGDSVGERLRPHAGEGILFRLRARMNDV
jgi:hypothetical protein